MRDVIFLAVTIMINGGIIYLLWRNNQVCKLQLKVVQLCYEWNIKHIRELIDGKLESSYDWLYLKGPTYQQMLWSYKPLTLDHWYPKKDLKTLFESL